MLAPIVFSVLLITVVAGLAWAVLTHERTDETERFNRARELTTSWADPSKTQEPALVPDDERDGQQR
jgi:hypothetical protein